MKITLSYPHVHILKSKCEPFSSVQIPSKVKRSLLLNS